MEFKPLGRTLQAVGPGISDVEGWRVAVLLIAFVVVTVLLEAAIEFLEHRAQKRKGLLMALQSVKNELLYVGCISLLLSAFQGHLERICINKQHYEGGKDPYNTSSSYGSILKRLRRRSLLAGSSDSSMCGEGKESLWPASLQHDTHIFIFIIACTHVVYSTATVYLTLLKVRRWKHWESEAQDQAARGGDQRVMQMPAKWLYRNVGSNRLYHAVLNLAGQFTVSVSQPMYHNARLMFIEKMGLPYDFNFHGLVEVSMEEELARTMHMPWHLWIIAVIWFAIPAPSYVAYWMYGIAMIVLLAVGGKLVDILVQIAVQVALKYGDSVLFGRMDADPRVHLDALGRSSLGLSALGRRSRRLFHGSDTSAAASGTESRFDGGVHGAALDGRGSSPVRRAPVQWPGFGGGASLTRQQAIEEIRSWATGTSGGGPSDEARGAAVMAAAGGGARAGSAQLSALATMRRGPAAGPQLPSVGSGGAASGSLARASAPNAPPRQLRLMRSGRLAAGAEDAAGAAQEAGGSGGGPQRQRSGRRAPALPHGVLRVFTEGEGGAGGGGMGSPAASWRRGSGSGRFSFGIGSLLRRREDPPTPHLHHLASIPEGPSVHGVYGPGGGGAGGYTGGEGAAAGAPAMRTLGSPFEAFQRSRGPEADALHAVAFHTPFQAHAGQRRPGPVAEGAEGTEAEALQPRAPAHAATGAVAPGAAQPASLDSDSVDSGVTASASGRGSAGARNEASSPKAGPPLPNTACDTAQLAGGLAGADAAAAVALTPPPRATRSRPGLRLRRKGTGGSAGPTLQRSPSVVAAVAVGLRRVPLLLRPCYCGAKWKKGHKLYVQDLLAAHRQRGHHDSDAADFFWFRSPTLITRVFTLAYFGNSLSIAFSAFALAHLKSYEGLGPWDGVPVWAIAALLAADLLILLHSSVCVLPLYALIKPLGSHCPKSVIRRAVKIGLYPRQMAAIARNFDYQVQARAAEAAAAAAVSSKSSFAGRLSGSLGIFARRLGLRPNANPHAHPHPHADARHRPMGPSAPAAAAGGDRRRSSVDPVSPGPLSRRGVGTFAVAGNSRLQLSGTPQGPAGPAATALLRDSRASERSPLAGLGRGSRGGERGRAAEEGAGPALVSRVGGRDGGTGHMGAGRAGVSRGAGEGHGQGGGGGGGDLPRTSLGWLAHGMARQQDHSASQLEALRPDSVALGMPPSEAPTTGLARRSGALPAATAPEPRSAAASAAAAAAAATRPEAGRVSRAGTGGMELARLSARAPLSRSSAGAASGSCSAASAGTAEAAAAPGSDDGGGGGGQGGGGGAEPVCCDRALGRGSRGGADGEAGAASGGAADLAAWAPRPHALGPETGTEGGAESEAAAAAHGGPGGSAPWRSSSLGSKLPSLAAPSEEDGSASGEDPGSLAVRSLLGGMLRRAVAERGAGRASAAGAAPPVDPGDAAAAASESE